MRMSRSARLLSNAISAELRQKISGSWRTSSGASHFLALRAYISTAHKQGRHTIDVLTRLAAKDPLIPQAAGP